MSYSRDRDAVTRGPGAIAARDHAHPHAARARSASRDRVLAHRDRILSQITYGERGGLSGLGAISTNGTVSGMTGGLRRPGLVDGGIVEGRPPLTGGGKLPPITPTSRPPRKLPPLTKPPIRTAPVKPTRLLPTRDNGAYPINPVPVVIVDPVKPPSIKPVVQVPLISGGGGGGGGGGFVDPLPEVPELEAVDLPDDITVDPGPTAAPPSSKRNLAILLAVVGGAYLLLRDKDGS